MDSLWPKVMYRIHKENREMDKDIQDMCRELGKVNLLLILLQNRN